MSNSPSNPAAALGVSSEAAVSNSLQADGWRVLARNWRGGGGEIDVIALRGDVLRIVEVKARSRTGRALEAVTRPKQRRIAAATQAFLMAHPELDGAEISFCVVTVEASTVEWYVDAFDAAEGSEHY